MGIALTLQNHFLIVIFAPGSMKLPHWLWGSLWTLLIFRLSSHKKQFKIRKNLTKNVKNWYRSEFDLAYMLISGDNEVTCDLHYKNTALLRKFTMSVLPEMRIHALYTKTKIVFALQIWHFTMIAISSKRRTHREFAKFNELPVLAPWYTKVISCPIFVWEQSSLI